ncbi:hypothetical protein D1Z30_11685 [Enterococcus faecalis]|nr:hypothetical protein [Enterococcus faecalis]
MKFLVSTFPKKVGSISVDEKFVKINIPSSGIFFKNEKLESIPIINISNAQINKKTNGIMLILGWLVMVIFGGFGSFRILNAVFQTMIRDVILPNIFGGLLSVAIGLMGYLMIKNAKKVVIIIEKSGISTKIVAPSSESQKLNSAYELIFTAIQQNIR